MPQVAVGALISGVVAGSSLAAGIGFSVSTFAISLALGALGTILSPKPQTPDLSSFASIKSNGNTQQFRQAVTERRLVYGEVRVSGPIAFVAATEENKYLHYIIVLATHEVSAIDEIIIDDVSIPADHIDSDGNVTEGKYEGLIRIKRYLGTQDQVADEDLIAEVSDWTIDHKLSGCAYLYARVEWDRDVFPSQVPNVSAWVRGKKVVDPRTVVFSEVRVAEDDNIRFTEDNQTRVTEFESISITSDDYVWSPNIAMHVFDYMTDQTWGIGIDSNNIDNDSADSAVNLCDEIVPTRNINIAVISANQGTNTITLDGDILQFYRGDRVSLSGVSIGGVSEGQIYYVIPYQRQDSPRIQLAISLQDAIDGVAIDITSDGTATIVKDGEPRYHGGGVIKLSAEHGNNLEELLTGMGGKVVKVGAKYLIRGLEYQTPTISLDESDIIGDITVQTKDSKRDRFNTVQGVYLSMVNKGNPSDYPVVQSSTYLAADGQEITRKIDLPFTQRSNTAQRIAKIILERSRQEIKVSARFKLTAFKVQAGDNVMLTFDRYGWDEKVFEVVEWSLSMDGVKPVIDMTLKENASAVYDFTSATDESLVDPAPNSNLPNPFIVTVPTGFNLDSIPVSTANGDDLTYKIKAAWDAHPNQFVSSGGSFEIQTKLTGSETWVGVGLIDGNRTEAEIFQAELNTTYDVRIRAVNSLGVQSNFSLIEEFVVGLTGGITAREDWEYQTIAARDGDDWEADTLSSEDWE